MSDMQCERVESARLDYLYQKCKGLSMLSNQPAPAGLHIIDVFRVGFSYSTHLNHNSEGVETAQTLS
jgi:hypothetical protein